MGLFRASSKHSKHAENISAEYDENINDITPAFGGNPIHTASHAFTPEEVIGIPTKPTQQIRMEGAENRPSPLENLRNKVVSNKTSESNNVKPDIKSKKNTVLPQNMSTNVQPTKDEAKTLLEKCIPFISQDGKLPQNEEPAYKLDSFEKIINTSGSKAAELLERLNKISTVTYDDLSGNNTTYSPVTVKDEHEKTTTVLEIEKIDMVSEVNSEPTVAKTYEPLNSQDFTRTISFDLPKNDEYDDISSGKTRIIDLSDEFLSDSDNEGNQIHTNDVLLNFSEENETLEEDYTNYSDAKNIGKKLLLKLRNSKLRLFFTILFTAILSLCKIPAVHDALFVMPFRFTIICSIIFFIICLINLDIFVGVVSLFGKRKQINGLTGVVALGALIYMLNSIFNNTNPYNLLLFASLFVLFKCIADYLKASTILNNFRIIATKSSKYGIKLVDDRKITFAMAKNTINGDVLAATDVKAENILDFIKNTNSDRALDGKIGGYSLLFVLISIIIAFIAGFSKLSINSFLEIFAVMLGIFFAPTILFTHIYPLFVAGKKLNKNGAMITSVAAAEILETANAVTVRCSDIFPAGTVTLYNMKVLDPNSIDRTIVDAAAITKQVNSPLNDIFMKIAKTQGDSLPEASSVIYADRLGINGWVDDRHIFIGNRTLLEAHGIKTPPLDVDKRILRAGYFPVYVACNDTPCALLMVKYNVDANIAYELQNLCNTGVVVLIDTCDQNIVNEMICDYFGLYPDSVCVMGGSGSQLYKNITAKTDSISSVAAHKGSPLGLLSIFNCAARIKKCKSVLFVYHIISSIVMAAIYIYSSYLNVVSPIESGMAIVFLVLSIIISFIVSLFSRP